MRRLAVPLAILALGLAGGARAQEFSDVVVFGDSLSDAGNISAATGGAPGAGFVTNPDPVWASTVAGAFGAAGRNSLAGGSNHAWGGACANATATCLAEYPVPDIGAQIGQHLAPRGGAADPDALYAVWAGGNDIELALRDPATAAGAIAAAAGAAIAHVGRLQQAGARTILVFNIPDIGATPLGRSLPDAARYGLTAAAEGYNEGLFAGVAALGDGIVALDVAGLSAEVAANPAAYGFYPDVSAMACLAPQGSAVTACGPAGDARYPFHYAEGDNERFMFTDARHPSGAVHGAMANLALAALAAPGQVSLAGEGGLAAAAAHRAAMASAARSRPAGAWSGYARAGTGRSESAAPPRLGETAGDLRSLTFGLDRDDGNGMVVGAAVSLALHGAEVEGAELDTTAALGSLRAEWRSGGLRLAGALTFGRAAVEIERTVQLAAASRTESGSTEAGLFGAGVDMGWTFAAGPDMEHGPFAGVSWTSQEIDGYREVSDRSTSMRFEAFERDSLVARVGYAVSGSFGAESGLRPWASVAWEREMEDDPLVVTAGSNRLPGRFALPGHAPPGQWARVGVGVSAELGGGARAFAEYAGRFGEDSLADHGANLGLRLAF